MLKKLYKDYLDVVGAKPMYDYNFSSEGADRPGWDEAHYQRFVKTEPDSMDDVMIDALASADADRDLDRGRVSEQDMCYPDRESIYNALSFRAFNKSKMY